MTGHESTLDRIATLKQQRGAVILAHNYQPPAIQDLADMLGDSLELSRKAAASDAEVIVFCGVHFMAETAAMLAPGRPVLLPHAGAGCPMADMIDGPTLRQLRAAHPEAEVVCYVNSSAEVKALSDICCTSANAVRIVESLGDTEVIFVPDRNLGRNVGHQLGRELIVHSGFCPSHERITPEHVARARAAHPDHEVVVHPECRPETVAVADHAESTGGMVRLARAERPERLLVGTEPGMLHRLRREAPHKQFVAVTDEAVCPDMKRIGLDHVLRALETLEPRITVPAAIAEKAVRSVERMLAVS